MSEGQIKEEMERLTLLCIESEAMTKRALNVSAFLKLQSIEFLQQLKEREADVTAAQAECLAEVTAVMQMDTESTVLHNKTKQTFQAFASMKSDPWGTDHGGTGTDLGVVSQKFCGDSLGHHHAETNISYPDRISIVPL